MSTASDIRMYVEHLFEGRVLDAETIELKEEIYGNLVARYEDYLAQGMSAEEAYARTCEAVTSVDDVIGAGEKNEPAEPTRVMPGREHAAGPVPPPPASSEPPTAVTPPAPATPGTAATPAPRRWSTGVIVAVVAVVLVVAGIAGCTVFNLLDTQRANEDYRGQTSQTIQQVDEPGTTAEPTGGTDTTTSPTTDNGKTTSQTTGGQPTGTTQVTADDLSDQINAVAPETLSGYTSLSTASPDQDSLAKLVQGLPLSTYFAGANAGTRAGSLEVTYSYPTHDERDYIARDDDYVDRALVFNAAALMCTIGDLDTLTVYETEPDDDSPHTETDVHVFDRASMEEVLGVALDASQLTSENWTALRDQLMEKRAWDRIWDRADRD